MDLQHLARQLGATPMFSRLPPEARLALLEGARHLRAGAGQWLTDAEGLREHLVLLAGELEAHRAWIDDDGRPRSNAWRVGLSSGEPGFALLAAHSRGVRVQAIADAECLALDADKFDAWLGWSCLARAPLTARHAGVLQRLPLENLQQVVDRMVERPAAAGEAIVTQGEPADAYYVLLAGEAEVWLEDPITDETRRANLLGPGDGFGEEALLLEASRTATVRMLSPGRLLVLAKADFDALLAPPMVEEVEPARAHEMLHAGAATLVDCRYDFEFEETRIPGARHVPLDRLRQQGVFSLDPQATYLVYCRSGRRSKAAAFLLRERGFRALSIRGGTHAWPYGLDTGVA